MASDRTRPTDETRAFERADAAAPHRPDEMPTPEEEEAAEGAGPPSDETREHYEEMLERGARQRGEGRIP